MNRSIDILAAVAGIILTSPVLVPAAILIWLEDRHSPFYVSDRIGINGTVFRMVKLRSMIFDADKSGVDSTGANDQRITAVGRFVRRYKLDEFTQLWNVLMGEMSLVGPRPNVKREVNLYTKEEKLLLSVKPGITDFSSIVFSDEGEILRDLPDPDLAYHQLIRPIKSMLGLFYIEKRNFIVDLQLILLTFCAIISRDYALRKLVSLMRRLGAQEKLCQFASRKKILEPMPPPGSDRIVVSRDVL